MILTEIAAKQAREANERLQPRRALYSSTVIALSQQKPKPNRPIVCDGCEQRAGSIGPMTFHCARCEIVIRVSPGLGRVEYTESQFAETLGGISIDAETLRRAEESSKLEPLDPTEY